MRERSIDETRDLLQRVVAEMNAPFRRYDFANAEVVFETMAGQYIEFDYRRRHWAVSYGEMCTLCDTPEYNVWHGGNYGEDDEQPYDTPTGLPLFTFSTPILHTCDEPWLIVEAIRLSIDKLAEAHSLV